MTEAEYRAAIDRLSDVWDAPYDTPEGDERDRLLRMKREGIVAVRRPESDTP